MINLKSETEIKRLRNSNYLVAKILKELKQAISPGVVTQDLNSLAEKRIREKGGIPAFKGYQDYPASLCVSINEQVVHGIPGKRKIREGDIVSLDLGIILDGFYGDSAITVPAGHITGEAERLIEITRESLFCGIEKARVGNRLFDISFAIQSHVEKNGFSVVRKYVGHGIGRDLHEDPQIPNFGKPHRGPRLQEGMVLAIEPMVNAGGHEVRVLPDKWTAVTIDGKLSAHFEHSIVITENGPQILSLC